MTKMFPLFDLAGRIVLITGAAGHLGRAMSLGLARAGAHVLLAGRHMDAIESLAAAINREQGHAEPVHLDVEDAAQVQTTIRGLQSRHAHLDVLVNNAYNGKSGSFAQLSDTDYEDSYRIGVVAPARLIRLCADWMQVAESSQGAGSSVINVSSMYGMVSPDFRVYDRPEVFNAVSYGAAKAALAQMTRYLACQLISRGIRVNSLSPGPFPSESVQSSQPELCARLVARVPMGRLGAPEDLMGPIIFLASDASAFVNGMNLVVDGGWTAW